MPTSLTGPFPLFYFITDPDLSRNGMVEDVSQALAAGAGVVQYRDKAGPGPSRERAERLRALCQKAGVPFVVNDDVELALAVGADGVHVGQGDLGAAEVRKRLGPGPLVGVSVTSRAELRAAEAGGASYVAASPVFGTPTKPDAGPGIGVDGVRALRAATRLPLAVIGGVHAGNIPALVTAGADLVCAISASLANGTIEANIRALRALMSPPSRPPNP